MLDGRNTTVHDVLGIDGVGLNRVGSLDHCERIDARGLSGFRHQRKHRRHRGRLGLHHHHLVHASVRRHWSDVSDSSDASSKEGQEGDKADDSFEVHHLMHGYQVKFTLR